jgi:hypothetical protein
MINRHSGLSLTGALLSSTLLLTACSADTGTGLTTDHVDVQVDEHLAPRALTKWAPPATLSTPGAGTSSDTPIGPNATRFIIAFEYAMRAAAKQARTAFPVTYSATTNTFAAGVADVDINKAAEMLNNIDEYDAVTKTSPRSAIGAIWASKLKPDFNRLFALTGNKTLISSAKVNDYSVVPYLFSWLVEPQSGYLVLSQLHDFVPYTASLADANNVATQMQSIFAAIASDVVVIRDGDVGRAICTRCATPKATTGGYMQTCSFDPPSDGTVPSVVPASTPGSQMASSLVSTSAIGCMPAGTALGQACVLRPYTTSMPNFVTTATDVDSTTYLAFSTQAAVTRVCSSLVQCKVR